MPVESIGQGTLARIEAEARAAYARFTRGLPFHGWHHVEFVRAWAARLARKNGADVALVEAAAIVHDLNYMVERNSLAATGRELRATMLTEAGVSPAMVEHIEGIVCDAAIESRHAGISLEAQALSDADTLFKALPTTPVLLAHKYMSETGASLEELCGKILRDQLPLLHEGIYFYDPEVRAQCERWAAANLRLWECIDESLRFGEVSDLVRGLAEAIN
jgi:uncharacterized protein